MASNGGKSREELWWEQTLRDIVAVLRTCPEISRESVADLADAALEQGVPLTGGFRGAELEA